MVRPTFSIAGAILCPESKRNERGLANTQYPGRKRKSMNSRLKRQLCGVTLALMVLLVLGAAPSSTASAQQRRPWDYGYPQRGRDRDRNRGNYGQQVAEQRGYSTGLDRGRDDARNHRSFNPNNSSHYRDGDSGYRSEYGSREAYRQAYRAAFRRGYENGYREFSRGRRRF